MFCTVFFNFVLSKFCWNDFIIILSTRRFDHNYVTQATFGSCSFRSYSLFYFNLSTTALLSNIMITLCLCYVLFHLFRRCVNVFVLFCSVSEKVYDYYMRCDITDCHSAYHHRLRRFRLTKTTSYP